MGSSSSSPSTSKSTSSSCASVGEAGAGGGGGFFFMRLGLYPFGLPRGRFTGTPSTVGTIGTVAAAGEGLGLGSGSWGLVAADGTMAAMGTSSSSSELRCPTTAPMSSTTPAVRFSTFWSAPSVSLARFAPGTALPLAPEPFGLPRGRLPPVLFAAAGAAGAAASGAAKGSTSAFAPSSARGDAGGVGCEILGGRPGPRFVATPSAACFSRGAFVATFLVFSAFSPGVLFLEPFGRPRPRFSGWLAGRGAGPGAGAAGDAATGAGAGADGADPSALSFARRFKSAGEGRAASPFAPIAPSGSSSNSRFRSRSSAPGPPGVGCLPPSTTCAARPLTVVSPGCCGLR
mmetsp:Transcript_4876/g.22368  ORF Transcript_4876/g.22368 Transcript_4876/m.22368 type:complete len:345 (-) Transcript_4876:2687-3721(-)